MKKLFFLTILSGLSITLLKAQSDVDALRYSQTYWAGTARFTAAGGAFGAVGGDYSALATNPASIGIYKKNLEITFTPVLSVFKTNSDYNNESFSSSRTNFNISNFGVILKATPRESSRWKGVQFGIGYNRINDFNRRYTIEGMSNNSSIVDAFIAKANGSSYKDLEYYAPFDSYLAWDTWLLDTIPGSDGTQYYSDLSGQPVRQYKYVTSEGAVDEMNFSIGANYDDKFYIGATVGVPFLRYKERSTYEEWDELDTIRGLKSLEIYDYLHTKGTGVNFKIGMLYQPVDYIRFGVAFHTPTYYDLKDNYERELAVHYDDTIYTAISDIQIFKYSLNTPFRVIGDIAFFIKKRAFISAEYEFADYSMMNMSSSSYSFKDENKNIQNKYRAMHIIRVGGEVTLNENFAVRLGYNYNSSPYQDNINDGSAHTVSAGLGFRSKNFFCDIAYSLKMSKEKYWLYDPDLVDPVNNKYYDNKIVCTLGFRL